MARVNLPLLKDCIEVLGVALASHHHQWTPAQRKLWENSWVEIRRNWESADPFDPPKPVHMLPNRGVVRRTAAGAALGSSSRDALQRKVI